MIKKRIPYWQDIPTFHQHNLATILGTLAQTQIGDLRENQLNAWHRQIEILKDATTFLNSGTVCFEYLIPRMGKRADNILILGNAVLVIEFKVGADSFNSMDINQTIDYALDLKNFHAESRHATLIPILVATNGPAHENSPTVASDGVADIMLANSRTLKKCIEHAQTLGRGDPIDPKVWLNSQYRPTPSIIEASQALMRGHSVHEITHSEAGAKNLTNTTQALTGIIDDARRYGKKSICLVTGVPGSGKTLTGLNLASEWRKADDQNNDHAVFLSGNGPLVKVLQEALARDEVIQAKLRGERMLKNTATRNAVSVIQNIHHFRDECLNNSGPPIERVVVFDEAQRAWDHDQTAKFMRQKRGRENFDRSEPAFLIGAMDRHEGWAVIVCLVGEGQEINTGEAGIEEWLRAIKDYHPNWHVWLPDQILSEDYFPRMNPDNIGNEISKDSSLHLGVSIRSFRSEIVSTSVSALLNGDLADAKEQLSTVNQTYPIRISRSLPAAKSWIRQSARGSERYGILTSSGARRLKPLGILAGAVTGAECNWFLNDADDVRSSFYMEDAATEFEVQGLELDWSIVVWDGDFIYADGDWIYRAFKGSKWQMIHKSQDQRYRLNAYRVLLTRARQGLVIVVPQGTTKDHTRLPEFYDPTWEYFQKIQLEEV